MKVYTGQFVLAHSDGPVVMVLAVSCDAHNGAFRSARSGLESVALDPSGDAPPGPGLWVWQGDVSYDAAGDPGAGYLIRCEGVWRPATRGDLERFGLPHLVVGGEEEFDT